MSLSKIPYADHTITYNQRSVRWSPDGMICVTNAPKVQVQRYPGSIDVGEDFTSDPILHKGNHIDALPYWSLKTSVEAPTGSLVKTVTVKKTDPYRPTMNVCGGFSSVNIDTYSFPAGSVPASFVSATKPVFSLEEKHFARKIAETKAVNKLRRGAASVPMLWLERQATFKAAHTRMNQLANLASDIHKRDMRTYRKIKSRITRRRFAKNTADAHLELIFGWVPLVEDVQGIIEYSMEPRFNHIKSSGNHTIKRVNSEANYRKLPWSESGPSYAVVQKTTDTLGYRCSLRADITSSLANTGRMMGFQPIYTLYDAVPLSFTLSWFSNFGSWIGAMDPLYGAEFRTGSVSEKLNSISSLEMHGISGGLPPEETDQSRSNETVGNVRSSASYDMRTRETLSAEPDTEFFFQNNLSMYSLLASVSLAVQKKLKIHKRTFRDSPFKLKSHSRRAITITGRKPRDKL